MLVCARCSPRAASCSRAALLLRVHALLHASRSGRPAGRVLPCSSPGGGVLIIAGRARAPRAGPGANRMKLPRTSCYSAQAGRRAVAQNRRYVVRCTSKEPRRSFSAQGPRRGSVRRGGRDGDGRHRCVAEGVERQPAGRGRGRRAAARAERVGEFSLRLPGFHRAAVCGHSSGAEGACQAGGPPSAARVTTQLNSTDDFSVCLCVCDSVFVSV